MMNANAHTHGIDIVVFHVNQGRQAPPRKFRSLRSYQCGAFYGQIRQKERGQFDFLDTFHCIQGFASQSPSHFCSEIAVQVTVPQNLRQPAATFEQAF